MKKPVVVKVKKILGIKATDSRTTYVIVLPSQVYRTFLLDYKPNKSVWSQKEFKNLLARLFPECDDLDSYKLKQRYYRLAELQYLPDKTLLGSEKNLMDKVNVVIDG